MIEGFNPEVSSERRQNQSSLYFIFHGREILLTLSNTLPIKLPKDLTQVRSFSLGTFQNQHCEVIEIEGEIPSGYETTNFRATFKILGDTLFRIAGRAYHLLHWDRTHQFCGVCSTKLNNSEDAERAKVCSNCNHRVYPRISPAIIVAVEKENKLLLAHAKRFPNRMFSVIAGFVEPGESLEECVKREVKEETGIEVKDIQYFGSQAWPFPDALMLGFTAKYAGGELEPDGEEIDEVNWFSIDDLPKEIPSNISISRKLIDWFIAKHK